MRLISVRCRDSLAYKNCFIIDLIIMNFCKKINQFEGFDDFMHVSYKITAAVIQEPTLFNKFF